MNYNGFQEHAGECFIHSLLHGGDDEPATPSHCQNTNRASSVSISPAILQQQQLSHIQQLSPIQQKQHPQPDTSILYPVPLLRQQPIPSNSNKDLMGMSVEQKMELARQIATGQFHPLDPKLPVQFHPASSSQPSTLAAASSHLLPNPFYPIATASLNNGGGNCNSFRNLLKSPAMSPAMRSPRKRRYEPTVIDYFDSTNAINPHPVLRPAEPDFVQLYAQQQQMRSAFTAKRHRSSNDGSLNLPALYNGGARSRRRQSPVEPVVTAADRIFPLQHHRMMMEEQEKANISG
jgi:hypothetical protein